MNNAKARKLQYLLITELLDKGSVEIILPDGITLEIGILQEDQFGESHKADDYCYVVATRQGRSAMLDSYNLGVQFINEDKAIVCESEDFDKEGRLVRTLDVV